MTFLSSVWIFSRRLLEICGAKAPSGLKLDGESLVPLLKNTGKLKRKSLFFHYPNYAFHRGNRLGGAIRTGTHKLIERFDDGSLELYDLVADIGEERNLASEKPDIAKRMVADLRAWRTETGANMPVKP